MSWTARAKKLCRPGEFREGWAAFPSNQSEGISSDFDSFEKLAENSSARHSGGL
jgi:hypothetical protein